MRALRALTALFLVATSACGRSARPVSDAESFDVIIRGGTVYNGSGSPGRIADVAIDGDRIVRVGNLGAARGKSEIDARGLAVAPGFINMLSWATESLIEDGRGVA